MTQLDLVALTALALQLADGLTTRSVLRRGGSERNPLVAALMRRLGIDAGLIVAKAASAATILALWLWQATAALAVLAAIYALVIANNLIALRRL